MKHLNAINRKAALVVASTEADVVALQQSGGGPPQQPEKPHIPPGCSTVFSPGWEADRTGGTAGLCQPVERDLFDCHMGCYWPAQVPDHLNNYPDWTAKCAAASVFLVALHTWIATRWRSFAVACGVGMGATVAGFLIGQSKTYGPWYPWSLPVTTLATGPVDLPLLYAYSACGALVVTLVGLWEFRRSEEV